MLKMAGLKMVGQLYHFAPWQMVTNLTQKIQKTVSVQSYFRGDIYVIN